MLSFLFLASVANANNAFSASNEFMAAAQRITSQLQAEMYMPVQSGRRLGNLKPCCWMASDKQCDMNPQFALQSGALDDKPDVKAWASGIMKCEAIKTQADCGKDATCEFKNNKCTMNEQEMRKFMMKVMQIDKCGAFVKAMMNPPAPKADACNDKKDKAGCTGACEWEQSYDYDDDTKKCIDESKCVTKPVRDPKDIFGIKQACPDMTDTQKDTCDKKADFKAKADCFMPICPHAAGVTAALTCMAAKDTDSCTKTGVCAWDGKACGPDVLKLYGSFIPDSCPIKSQFTKGLECSTDDKRTKAGCEKDKKCAWATRGGCDGNGKVGSDEMCDAADNDMFAGMTKDIFGAKLDAQIKKCQVPKDQAACEAVEANKDLVGGGGGATTVADMGTVPAISTFTTFLVGFLVAP